MPHFLSIAILYRDDYAQGGFRMLPVRDEGLDLSSRQILLYSLALIPVTLVPVLQARAGMAYFFLAVIMGLAFCGIGMIFAQDKSRVNARKLFIASIIYLPALLAAMTLDKL
jgi:protoheme IX farnesyltransferase